ncbi:MAG: hypothetical protein ACI4MS_04170 [Candidatus Coproplasma sp.]
MFGKKELTPREQIKRSQKRIARLGKKRDKLDDKYCNDPYSVPNYENKRKALNYKMANEYEIKNAAKTQLSHPAKQNNKVNNNLTFSKTEKNKSFHLNLGFFKKKK